MISRQSAAINSARAVLAIGVIVFHTARLFDPYVYYMKAEQQTEALGPLVLLGVIWAMPLFFFVAGFALWHSLESRGSGGYIRDRAKRLLLPLTIGLLTLVPFQIYISRVVNGEHVSYLGSMRDYLHVHFALALPFPVQGLWFDYSHLWFVAYLFSFSVLLLPFVIWARRRPAPPRISPAAGVGIWVGVVVIAAALEAWIGMEGTGAWDRWSYLMFMALGVLLACQPNFSAALGKRQNLLAVSAIVGFFALVVTAGLMHATLESISYDTDASAVLWRAGKGAVGVLFLMAIVASIINYQPKPKDETLRRKGPIASFFGYVSPISLPLYLLHLTLILTFAYFVLPLPVPMVVQFLAIVMLTLLSSIVIVEVAKRFRLGSLLLGMKYRPRERPARSEPQTPELDSEPARSPVPAAAAAALVPTPYG